MSKTFETKRKILSIISVKPKTLTDLSRALNLKAPTIKQHVDELKSKGMIRQLEDPYVKKWKYYDINPEVRMGAKAVVISQNSGIKAHEYVLS